MKIKEVFIKHRRALFSFAFVFSLCFGRFCALGFRYLPYLDDYIQYINYARAEHKFALIQNAGLLGARPLAGIMDVLFWGNFHRCFLIAVFLIAVMYAVSALVFQSCFHRQFGTGYFFCVVYALFPLAFEGTYWLSASSRIVVGLFFLSLALRAYYCFLDKPGFWRFVLFAVLHLISIGFYEQILILSVALIVIVSILQYRKSGKWALLGLVSILHVGWYFLFTHLFSDSATYSSRTEMILPVSSYYFKQFIPQLLLQFKHAFLGAGYRTLTTGLVRGIRILFADGRWLYLAFVFLICAAALVVLRRWGHSFSEKKRKHWPEIVCGILWALAPLSAFFIIANPWFSIRGIVPSLLGIALIADSVLSLLCEHLPKRETVYAVFCSVLALWFCIASVSELSDFMTTSENDIQIMDSLVRNLPEDTRGNIAVLNLKPSYVEDQNYYYHEHVHGVTESYWALHGAMVAQNGSKELPYEITPIPFGDTLWLAWNREDNRLDRFDALFLYHEEDGSLTRLSLLQDDSGDMTIVYQDGTELGYVHQENNIGYFRLAPGQEF